MKEKYDRWEPIKDVEMEMWVESVHDDYEGLRIILKGSSENSGILRISFPHYYGYRNVDESYRNKLWQKGDFAQRNWCLFKTTDSEFIDWIFEESGSFYNKEEMVHYLIKTGADVIEVVANQTVPVVEWLKSNGPNTPVGGKLIKIGKRGAYYDK